MVASVEVGALARPAGAANTLCLYGQTWKVYGGTQNGLQQSVGLGSHYISSIRVIYDNPGEDRYQYTSGGEWYDGISTLFLASVHRVYPDDLQSTVWVTYTC
jgi:hypothetical protein